MNNMKKTMFIIFLVMIMTNFVMAAEQNRYDRKAIPKIPDIGGSGIFDTGMSEKEIKFIGRISFIPNIPDNGTINIIVCEDWRGSSNTLYMPDDFCGAKISNGTHVAYAYPIIVQVPVSEINNNASLYSVAKIEGYLLPEIFYVDTIWGILTNPIIYANNFEIISEDEAQKIY